MSKAATISYNVFFLFLAIVSELIWSLSGTILCSCYSQDIVPTLYFQPFILWVLVGQGGDPEELQGDCRGILMQAVASAGLWNNAVTDNQACPNFNSVSPVTSPNGSGQCIHFSASVTSSSKLEKQWLASCRCCNDYRWCRGCYYTSASWYCCSFLQIFIKEMVKCHRTQMQKGMAEKINSR